MDLVGVSFYFHTACANEDSGHYGCNGSLGKPLADRCKDATTYTTKVVQKGKRYLLRLINGSASTSYRFSIDQHTMRVVSNDLVPIVPYFTDTVNIAIGQRYEVIVEADQEPGNYWMRTDMLSGCANMNGFGNQSTTAIWRYEGQDEKALPTSTTKHPVPSAGLPCVDEPYASLVPVVPCKSWKFDQMTSKTHADRARERQPEP
jgi:FtsP/CotA-like multicopper oxidase with cupredoxin domain